MDLDHFDLKKYSEMAKASIKGTPPIRALLWEFPNDSSLIGNDEQFMVRSSVIPSIK